MKEWRMTVGDYVQEVKDAHGNLLKNILLILFIVAVFFGGWAVASEILEAYRESLFEKYTALCDEMNGFYLDMCDHMETGEYESAIESAVQIFEAGERISEWVAANGDILGHNIYEKYSTHYDLLWRAKDKWIETMDRMTRAGQCEELVQLVRDSLYENVFCRFYDHELIESAPLPSAVRGAYLTYADELMEEGEYREAAEVLMDLSAYFGVPTDYESPAELYAEELRATGDEAGAEEWEAHVRSRYRGIMARKWSM